MTSLVPNSIVLHATTHIFHIVPMDTSIIRTKIGLHLQWLLVVVATQQKPFKYDNNA